MNYPEELNIGERNYSVEYLRERGFSSSVRIRNGVVVLKLSRFLVGKKREDTVENFLNWASKKLSKSGGAVLMEPQYIDGGRIVTHNKVYDLAVVSGGGKNCRVSVDGSLIRVVLADAKRHGLRDLVEKAIIVDQTSYLRDVLDELNQLYFQERYVVCRFKRMRGRFGSCSSRRNINIAFRLLFAPKEVFRYVCIHELAHLKEFNHSKRFWALVAEAMPEYKSCEKWLKNCGFLLG